MNIDYFDAEARCNFGTLIYTADCWLYIWLRVPLYTIHVAHESILSHPIGLTSRIALQMYHGARDPLRHSLTLFNNHVFFHNLPCHLSVSINHVDRAHRICGLHIPCLRLFLIIRFIVCSLIQHVLSLHTW